MNSSIELGNGKKITLTVGTLFAMRRYQRVFIALIIACVVLLLPIIFGGGESADDGEPFRISIYTEADMIQMKRRSVLNWAAKVVQHVTTESYLDTSRKLFPVETVDAFVRDSKPYENSQVRFEEDVLPLVRLARKIGLHLVLIEPCLLWNFLHADLQSLLTERRLVDKRITSCDRTSQVSLITFGVMDAELDKLAQLESQLSKQEYLTVSSTYSNRINHLFAKRNNRVIHLPVFNNVSNYLNITEINDVPDIYELLGVSKRDLHFGAADQLFDPIKAHMIKVRDTEVLIVSSIGSFLMNLKMSHFIDCNRKLANESIGEAKKIFDDSEAAKEMIDILKESLSMAYKMSSDLLLPLWLDGGTLLGWYRQCGPIDYDHDIDLATFLRYNKIGNDQYGLTKAIYGWLKSPWALMETFGFPWLAHQMRMWDMKTKWGVDIFFADEEPSNSSLYTFGYHPSPHVMYCKLDYYREAFDNLCSAVLVGVRVTVPCRPTIVLDHEYGVNEWRHPSKEFRINNAHCRDYYLPEEAPLAYQCVGVYGVQEAKQVNGTVDRSSWKLSESFKILANASFHMCKYVKRKSDWTTI